MARAVSSGRGRARNDFGGTVGGPVWIPKVYDGRNKTFFFYSYEYYKEAQGLTFTDTLPNAQYQAGNFGAISPNGGAAFNPALYGVPLWPLSQQQQRAHRSSPMNSSTLVRALW